MFPNTKQCLHKETKGSYSNVVIGILVIAILAVFVAFTLGANAFDELSDNSINNGRSINIDPLYSIEFSKSDNSLDTIIKADSRGHIEPVDHTVYNPNHQFVERGSIQFVTDSFNEDPADLPICMDLDFGEQQWVVLKVLGGYTPCPQDYFGYGNYYGLMTLTDKNGNTVYNDCIPGMFVGWLMNEPVDVSDQYRTGSICDCCYTWYNFTLNPRACNNWVCLDSSYQLDEEQVTPCKYYLIEYDTHWCGCEFDQLLAHVICVPESYTPDSINIASVKINS